MRVEMNYRNLLKGGLAAAMAFTMAACSSNSGSASGSTDSQSSGDAGDAGKTAFKLGGSGPLTGGAAVYGTAVYNALKIAVDEVNAAGDVQFELDFQDDAHDPEKAVTAYGVLKDNGMQLSVLTVTSAPGAAVAPLYDEDNIFAITPSGSSLAVIYADQANKTGAYGNCFQMCFTDPNQGSASAVYLNDHADLGSKIAVIFKSDDNYSSGINDTFQAEAQELGLDVVYTGSFTEDSATDFSVQLTQAKDAGADLVFLPIYYDPASLILTQANGMGYAPTFFGCDGLDGLLTLEGFDKALAEGVYMLTPFSADAADDRTQNFVKKYKDLYGETPNQFAADAYDCVFAIAQALKNGNATPDMSTDELTDILVKQFTSMTYDGITGESMTWSETGEVTKAPQAVIIKDGVYVGAE